MSGNGKRGKAGRTVPGEPSAEPFADPFRRFTRDGSPYLAITRIAVSVAMLLAAAHVLTAQARGAVPSSAQLSQPDIPEGLDLIQFLDGSFLHGALLGIDTEQGVRWGFPMAKEAIDFKPAGLAWIRFEKARPRGVRPRPTSQLRFNNGDEVFGELESVDSETARLGTWFGGSLSAPRRSLSSITFFAKGYEVVYEGPNGIDGWQLQKGSRGWRYRDGAFVAKGVGILGRDLRLSDSSELAFDLAWSGRFSLSFIICTEAIDRFDYSINSYMFHLAPGYVSLQRVQVGAGVISIGPQTPIPGMVTKNRARLRIRVNKADATIALWLDGALVRRWKDPSGFVAKGSGVVFSSQMDGTTLKISNVHVSQWDGDFDMREPPEETVKQDSVYLVNSDKVTGTIEGIRDGKLHVVAHRTSLGIPLTRVTQVFFAERGKAEIERKPWEIRADLSGGGTVAFELKDWNAERVFGLSANFGAVQFKPESIRRIQFNEQRAQLLGELSASNEEVWDLDE